MTELNIGQEPVELTADEGLVLFSLPLVCSVSLGYVST